MCAQGDNNRNACLQQVVVTLRSTTSATGSLSLITCSQSPSSAFLSMCLYLNKRSIVYSLHQPLISLSFKSTFSDSSFLFFVALSLSRSTEQVVCLLSLLGRTHSGTCVHLFPLSIHWGKLWHANQIHLLITDLRAFPDAQTISHL